MKRPNNKNYNEAQDSRDSNSTGENLDDQIEQDQNENNDNNSQDSEGIDDEAVIDENLELQDEVDQNNSNAKAKMNKLQNNMDLDELMNNLENQQTNKHNGTIPHDQSMNDELKYQSNIEGNKDPQLNFQNINKDYNLSEERNTMTHGTNNNADILRLETLDKELEEKRQDIIKKFAYFLKQYKPKHETQKQTQTPYYASKIDSMVGRNKRSLEVDWRHLVDYSPELAVACQEKPEKLISMFNTSLYQLTKIKWPGQVEEKLNLENLEMHIRFYNINFEDSIRELRNDCLGKLLNIRGVVTKRTGVNPQTNKLKVMCASCGCVLETEIYYSLSKKPDLGKCPDCNKRYFKVMENMCKQRNFQKINIQEPPNKVEPGRIPRQREIIVLDDLVDTVKPGDEVLIIGEYKAKYDQKLNAKNNFPVFHTFIEANNIKKVLDHHIAEMDSTQLKKIKELSRDPLIIKRIIKSICPSIFGHENIKEALAVALFSGVHKVVNGGQRLRGDINVLLMGDPGLGKSQFLKWITEKFDRCVQTTGKGSSSVGLTAGCHKDPVTGEFTLEGGSLVLADNGVCCIDEFDKMNDVDRTSIHEAMEQQTISISKAGIVAQLQARCSVIASANPVRGRQISSMSFQDNVDLSEPIVSRFDLVLVLKDEASEQHDRDIANQVINSHFGGQVITDNLNADADDGTDADLQNRVRNNEQILATKESFDDDLEPIDLATLRMYVNQARTKVRPKISTNELEYVSNVYCQLRKESQLSGGISIVVRNLDSIIRLSEAQAKMQLEDQVNSHHIKMAIKTVLQSFIGTQKSSIAKSLGYKFRTHLHIYQDSLLETQTLLLKMMKLAKQANESTVDVARFSKECDEFNLNCNLLIRSRMFNSRFTLTNNLIKAKL